MDAGSIPATSTITTLSRFDSSEDINFKRMRGVGRVVMMGVIGFDMVREAQRTTRLAA